MKEQRAFYRQDGTRNLICVFCLRERTFIPCADTEHLAFKHDGWRRLLRTPSLPHTRSCMYCGEEYRVA
jgi:hypothetical protein